jgi:hypothetical protein
MAKDASIAAPAAPPDPPAEDPAAVDEAELLAASAARIEHRLRLLDELAEIAMNMVRGVAEQSQAAKAAAAESAKAGATPADTAHDFGADDLAKLSRAVRLTLDLAGRLEEALRALRAGEATARETRRETRAANDNRATIERSEAVQNQVREQVTIAIAREAESEADSCDLLEALDERLDDDIAYVFVGQTPLRETVERICKDLGLSPDWSGWTAGGWPQAPADGFPPRSPWSPFNRPSRKPLLYKNRNYERREFEVIDPSP